MAKKQSKKSKDKSGLYIALLLTLFLVISIASALYFIFLRTTPTVISNSRQEQRSPKEIDAKPYKTPFKPRIAIIIDDIGNQKRLALALMKLDLNLSFSVMPFRPFSRELALKAVALHHDVLLHLPMEPHNLRRWNPGPGALLLSMSHDKMRLILDQDLTELPMVIGVNNHMGSKFTENIPAMTYVLKILKARHLIWLDSLTSPKSVGFRLGRKLGLKTASRDVFLDNTQSAAAITVQLNKLIKLADRRGYAIGIAHPHPSTLKALRLNHERLKQKVMLLGLQQLVTEKYIR
ncbi:divergent polysaccharide deacetylase family protein [Desulfobacterota bacterium M19]